jgi:RNA polymerase sigma-70 factor (ECF subfamily)
MEGAKAALHDVELAALAAAGDRAAYGELVRRHGSAVRGLLRRMGADAAAADDLAQDAFIVGFEQVADFRGEGAFAGWIKRIAARLYLRRMKRDALLLLTDQTPDEGDPDALDQPRAANRLDLDAALKGLSPVERLCVSLCYGADLSHSEAAEALNLPLGTVKSHVKRGLDKLRAKLAPAGEPDDKASTRLGHG